MQAKSEKYDVVKESLEELKMSAELVEEAEAQAMDAISAVDEVTQQVKRLKEETEKLSDTPQEQNRLEMFYASMEQVLEQDWGSFILQWRNHLRKERNFLHVTLWKRRPN